MGGKKGGFSLSGAASTVFGGVSDTAKAGYKLFEKGKEALYVAVPITALAAAFMVSKLLSPGGVRENIPDIVINNNEKSNLIQSIRELERLEMAKRLNNTSKIHDQFV